MSVLLQKISLMNVDSNAANIATKVLLYVGQLYPSTHVEHKALEPQSLKTLEIAGEAFNLS